MWPLSASAFNADLWRRVGFKLKDNGGVSLDLNPESSDAVVRGWRVCKAINERQLAHISQGTVAVLPFGS